MLQLYPGFKHVSDRFLEKRGRWSRRYEWRKVSAEGSEMGGGVGDEGLQAP